MSENRLYFGDNLEVMRRHLDGNAFVDLVYLDPPFNSAADYNAFFTEQDGSRSAAQIKAFTDTWRWDRGAAAAYQDCVEQGGRVADCLRGMRGFLGDTDMLAYLAMMAPRLVELRRVLKPTGSIYLHCDSTASHYLKILMDAVFGPERYRNEIIWKRTNARSTKDRWPRLHDVLLYYAKGATTEFFPTVVKADKAKLPHTLITAEDGKKYQTFELTGPGITADGDSGMSWRGFDPSAMGRHWANCLDDREEWDKNGLIHWPLNDGFPRRRAAEPFDEDSRMVVVGDIWTDIDRINQTAKERLGYPTQKPEALLERIIRASSNEGDVVLDPFCGCGTAVAVAQRLKRRWIGIDVTHLAITLMKRRLRDAFGDAVNFSVIGEPKDLEGARSLAESDPYQFQWWALGLLNARPAEEKKGADKGIDGKLYFHDDATGRGATRTVIFSVKAGGVTSSQVRDLVGVITRESAAIGVLISMVEPTKPMRAEAASAGFYESPWGSRHPRMQLLTIEEILAGKRVDVPAMKQTDRTFKAAPNRRSLGIVEDQKVIGVTEADDALDADDQVPTKSKRPTKSAAAKRRK